MPIEIRELNIRVNVTPGTGQAPADARHQQGGQQPNGNGGQGGAQSDVVSEAVEQVMEIIRNRMER